MTDEASDAPTKEQLLKTSGVAALLAVAALFIAVLPAEYGIDPLRTGALLGLMDNDEPRVSSHRLAQDPLLEYTVSIELQPGSGWHETGLKMWLDEGEGMMYRWNATGIITYDLHTDQLGSYPDGAGDGTGAEGFFTAPASAYHGFAVRNDGDAPVTFNLRYVGEFDPAQDSY